MSNQTLPAATIAGYHGPLYPSPFERLQDRYRPRAYAKRPIDGKFLRAVVGSLELFLSNIEFEEQFETEDGTRWFKVGFDFADGLHYVVLFPTADDREGRDGFISTAHIALYARVPDGSTAAPLKSDDKRVTDLARTFLALVEGDFQMYYSQQRKRS